MKKYLIILFILALPISAWAIDEREGFCKLIVIIGEDPVPVLTVPEGKCFVLLQLNANGQWFKIKVNGTNIIDGKLIISPANANGSTDVLSHDFPDRCVIVNSGETLTVEDSFPSGTWNVNLNIIGYFYNCNCVSLPVGDLTKDCKVDFADLAVLASEWLKDGNV